MIEQMKSKPSIWKELINIRAEIIEIEKKVSKRNQWNKTVFLKISIILITPSQIYEENKEKDKNQLHEWEKW